ncbi:DapH/DapD/GlmU-related protein [Leptolyngbya sp. FACHB-261]|uniref:acyltransferase n=1 Tax=Leptolyngbya sp. FACHB-261 TaxID=2692806 RepID=UPI001688E09C|nr:acyltransferase [Leptolyngbya sp. FACHB-261]MBD2101745.1 acyltransferase [Leptolyngbya sp. FACHB-261]
MSVQRLIATLLREPGVYIKRWFRCHLVQYKNPGLTIGFPIAWLYDDLSGIEIGSQVVIEAFSDIVVLTKSPYSKVPGRLVIQDRVLIGSHSNIRAAGGEISIGRNSILGQQVSLIASNHRISNEQSYQDLEWDEIKTGVFIDENVWLGARVTILPGCSIGKNSVIGAGSVVTKNVPANEVWAGIPAKKLRDVSSGIRLTADKA